MANSAPLEQRTYTLDIIKKSNPYQTENYSCFYTHKEDHRDGTRPKSQWTCTLDEEFTIFKDALNNEWCKLEEFKYKKTKYKRLCSPNGRAWGLRYENDKFLKLGKLNESGMPIESLSVSVFVEGTPNSWHGYPANFTKRQDRPLDHVLKKWKDLDYIRKRDILKIKRGAVCSL